jgi:hypothetical protein
MSDIDEHRRWCGRDKTSDPEDDAVPCDHCGCDGNCHCGHEPLAAPEHNCELCECGEEWICYCCLALEAKKEKP